MSDLLEGQWQRIDEAAENGARCLVRRGQNYAKACFENGAWWYAGTSMQLDFVPLEYRVD